MSLRSLRGSMRPFPILRLAVADLKDEWLLSMCVALAVAAVLAPLMILFGLKNGAIEIMRDRLVEDPRNRELRPKITRTFDQLWFDQMARNPDVAFITPLTRGISSTVEAGNAVNGAVGRLDLSPTGAGDALVTQNGSRAPREGECVLTAAAAEELGLAPGDTVEIRTSRRTNGQLESAELQLNVAGVLDLRAGGAKIAYVLLPVVEAVEKYLDGQAVEEFGWRGTQPLAFPEFDGALLIAPPGGLDPAVGRSAVTETGFVRLEQLQGVQIAKTAGFDPLAAGGTWLLRPAGSTVRMENFEALREALRGSGVIAIPWIEGIPATLKASGGASELVKVLAAPPPGTSPDGVAWPVPAPSPSAEGGGWRVPGVWSRAGGEAQRPQTLAATGLGGELLLPVDLATSAEAADGVVLLPSEVAGILRQAQSRHIKMNSQDGTFLVTRRGYSGFRMFAKSIDRVDALRRTLESQEIPVFHEGERINDVRTLDLQLSRFFWFIALVGLVGAIATLAASLYAAAERKSYELAVLRLLGIRGREIIQFPAWQAMILTTFGFALALGIYSGASVVLGQVFSDQLRPGETLTVLPAAPVTLIFGALLALSFVSSLLASFRILQTDLSEALRGGSL